MPDTEIPEASERRSKPLKIILKEARSAFFKSLAPEVPLAPAKPRRPVREPVRLAGCRVDIRFAEIDNPYFTKDHDEGRTNPRRVQAARNSNESPLVRLEAHGSIDPAQAAAGHKFRALFERLMAGQASPSNLREHVDGSSGADIFTEGRMLASFQLRKAAERVPGEEYRVLHLVCGEGVSMNEVARRFRARPSRVRALLLSGLDRLAEVWNLVPANRNATRR